MDDRAGEPPRERLHVVSPDTPQLAAIFDALTQARGVRTELVDEVRAQVADGEYMSREKLDLAIYRMLKDVLR